MDLAALSEIKEHPEMLSAFEARGIKDLSKVESRASRDLVLRMIMGAGNYDYLFNFRFDVDGQNNSLLVDRLVTERQGADNPRRSVWRVETEVAKREKDAMRTSSLTAPEKWRVVNPSRIVPPATPAATWSRDTAS